MTWERDMTQEELMRRWGDGIPAHVRPPMVRNLTAGQVRIRFTDGPPESWTS